MAASAPGQGAGEGVAFEPGSRFGYSNSGFVVLGAVVEAVTGQDYYDYVRNQVLEPARMTNTGWYTLDQIPNMAHRYMQVDGNGMRVSPGPRPLAWVPNRASRLAGKTARARAARAIRPAERTRPSVTSPGSRERCCDTSCSAQR